jgi:parallel beta-helix repeat protein
MTRALATALCLLAAPALAATLTVHPGESIQTAIDAAPDGSTIRIMPGVYHHAGGPRALTVTKHGIRLVGLPRHGRPVVLEASGTQIAGLWVSPADSVDVAAIEPFNPEDSERPPCGLSGQRIQGFQVRGLTVRGFAGFGIFLACVDDFVIQKNTASDNYYYAIFPVRSAHGRLSRNLGTGTKADACLYVGQSEDVLVDRNRASDCLIGLQLENTLHCRMRSNRSTGNTAGVIVDVIDKRQTKVAADNEISRNEVTDNNRPNTSPPGTETAQIPSGIGIIINGADRTLVSHNRVERNGFAGLTITDFCIGDPGACAEPGFDIDPHPEANRIVENRFAGNAIDVVFAPGGGTGNCFDGNRPANLHSTGAALPSCP